jgi:hypothetical protein
VRRRTVLIGVSGAAVAGLIVWNCTRHRDLLPSEIRPLPYAATRGRTYVPVSGIDSGLHRSGRQPVRVLVVHGMKTYVPGYSTTLQAGLGKRLGLRPATAPGNLPSPLAVERGYRISMGVGPQPLDTVSLRPSELRTWSWTDSTGQDRLIYYELLWAPMRDAIKQRFFACFESPAIEGRSCPKPAAEPNRDRRARVNALLKDEVLVDGIADATIVLGPVGDVLRDDVSLAFCHVALDVLRGQGFALPRSSTGRCDFAASVPQAARQKANGLLQKAEFFVVTHSLGSFLVMDAQWHALQRAGARSDSLDPDATARDVAAFHILDDATVFMRANQIALLQLARLQAWCAPPLGSTRCPNEALDTEDDVFLRPQPSSMMTTYVAFNDANDLLGFELPPYLTSPGMFGTMVNVTVRNPSRWSVPSLFKDPGDAHLRSDENPVVLGAIAHGFALPQPESLNVRVDR